MDAKENKGNMTRRCEGVTRAGRPCGRRVVDERFCRSHASHTAAVRDGAPTFYARALDTSARERYAEALTQEGLTGEVAVLRLHLLRLLERNDEDRPGEIPRTVHALIRALRGKDGASDGAIEALDALVRAEGLRLLDAEGDPAALGAAIPTTDGGRVVTRTP